MKRCKLFVTFVFLALCIGSVSAYPLLNASSIGAASMNYSNNFYNLTNNFMKAKFNTTQTFTEAVSGKPILWTPWYDSSTSCAVANLKTDDFAAPNMTLNTLVTDEFSEFGMLLAQGNNESAFVMWDNTVHILNLSAYGQLPCWRATRNLTTVNCTTGDTAEDASVRVGLAYFYAAKNTLFNATNRTYYTLMGINITRDHLRYEVNNTQTENSSVTGGTITYIPFSGAQSAQTGFASSPQFYIGYYPESIKLLLAAYNATGNATYLIVADDYVDSFLVASNYTGGTTGADYKVAPFNFNWNITAPTLRIINTSGVNQIYWPGNLTAWDDSDAPRAMGICDVLRAANITYNGVLTGAYRNLSDYCLAWSNSGMYNGTVSTLQYYRNGTNSTSIRTGYYENGLGLGAHTYFTTSTIANKINETLSHYTFNSGTTYDSSVCYGLYRGVRPAKSLADAIGLNDYIYGQPSLPFSPSASAYVCTGTDRVSGNLILLVGVFLIIGPFLFIFKVGFSLDDMGDRVTLNTLFILFIVVLLGIAFVVVSANNIAAVCSQ